MTHFQLHLLDGFHSALAAEFADSRVALFIVTWDWEMDTPCWCQGLCALLLPPQKCPSHLSLSPGEVLQVSDPANVGLFPCCFLGHCLWEMLLCWCPHAEQSFDSGRWPWPHGFGGDILPPALPWSLRQALVLFPARCCVGIKQAFPLLSLLSNI